MRICKKILSLVLSVTLLDFGGMSSEIYGANTYELAYVSGSQEKATGIDYFQSLKKSPLRQYTNLGEFFPSTRKDNPAFIHIRDLHCNYEAQMNIAKTLEMLAKENPGSELLVLTEGADGLVDTSFFGSFPDRKIKEEASRAFVKKGKITGPEYLAIAKHGEVPFKIQGVEDAKLYVENFKAFRDVISQGQEALKLMDQIGQVMEQIERKVFSRELLELDEKKSAYEKETVSFDKYASFLSEKTRNSKPETRNQSYPNFELLMEVMEKQKEISLEEVEKERNGVMAVLSEKVSKEGLGKLIKGSLEFRLGKISAQDYFSELEQLVNEHLEESNFPNLSRYIELVKLQAKINQEELQEEVKDIETELRENLTKTDEEREILEFSKQLEIIQRMLRLEMMREDLVFYKGHKELCSVETIGKKLNQFVLKYSVAVPKNFLRLEEIQNIARVFNDGKHFYELALQRDKMIVEKALKFVNNAQLATRNRVIVLITGGFHSGGVTELLKQKDISYLVMTPKVTAKPNMTTYYNLMLDGRISVATISFFSIFNRAVADLLSKEMRVEFLKEFVADMLRLMQQGRVDQGILRTWVQENEKKENLEKSYRELLKEVRGRLEAEEISVERVAPITQDEIRELIWDFSMLTAEMTVQILPQMKDEILLQYAKDELEKRRQKERSVSADVEFPHPKDPELYKYKVVRPEQVAPDDFSWSYENDNIGHFMPRGTDITRIFSVAEQTARLNGNSKPIIVSIGAGKSFTEFLLAQKGARVISVDPNAMLLEEVAKVYGLQHQTVDVQIGGKTQKFAIYQPSDPASLDMTLVVADAAEAPYVLNTLDGLNLPPFSEEIQILEAKLKTLLDQYDNAAQHFLEDKKNSELESVAKEAFEQVLNVSKELEIKKTEFRKGNPSKIDVAFNSWMPRQVDFSEQIRDLGAPAIVYVGEAGGATGFEGAGFYEESIDGRAPSADMARLGLIKPTYSDALTSSGYRNEAGWYAPAILGRGSEIKVQLRGDVRKIIRVTNIQNLKARPEERLPWDYKSFWKGSRWDGVVGRTIDPWKFESVYDAYGKLVLSEDVERLSSFENHPGEFQGWEAWATSGGSLGVEAPANVMGGGVSFDQLAKWIAEGKHDLALANFRAFVSVGESSVEVNKDVLQNLHDFFTNADNFNRDEAKQAKAQEKLMEFLELLYQEANAVTSIEATLFHGSNLYALYGAIVARKNGAQGYRLWSGENAEKYNVPIFRVEPGAADDLVSLSPSLMTARGYASKAGHRNLMNKEEYIAHLRKNLEEMLAIYAEIPPDHPVQVRAKRSERQMNLLIEALGKMDEAEFENIQRLLSIPIVIGSSDKVMSHRGIQHSQVPEVPIKDYVDFENEVVEIRVGENDIPELAQMLGQMGLAHKIQIIADSHLNRPEMESDRVGVEPLKLIDGLVEKEIASARVKEGVNVDWLITRLKNGYYQVLPSALKMAEEKSAEDLQTQLSQVAERERRALDAGDTFPQGPDPFGKMTLELACAIKNIRASAENRGYETPSLTATLFKGRLSWLKNLPARILFGVAVPVQETTHIILAKILGLPVKWSLGSLWSSVQIDYTRAPPWKRAFVRLGGLFSNIVLGLTALAIFGAPALTLAAFFAFTNIALFFSDLVLSLILRRGDFWDALRDLGWVKGPDVTEGLEGRVERAAQPERTRTKNWEDAIHDRSVQGARLRMIKDTTGLVSSDQEIVKIAQMEAAQALVDLGLDPAKHVMVVADSDAVNAALYPAEGEQVIEIAWGLLLFLKRNGILDKETLKFILGHEGGHALIEKEKREDKNYNPTHLATEYQADEYGLFGLDKGDGEKGYTPVAALKFMEALRREQKNIKIIITTTHPHTHRRQVKIFNDIRHNYWSNLGVEPTPIDENFLELERGERHQFDGALYKNLSLKNIQSMLSRANSFQDIQKAIHLLNIVLNYKAVLEELKTSTGVGIELKDEDLKQMKNVMDGIFKEKGSFPPEHYAHIEKYLRDEEINPRDVLGEERVSGLRKMAENYYGVKSQEFNEEIFNDLLFKFLARIIGFKHSEMESAFTLNRSRLSPFSIQDPIQQEEEDEGVRGFYPGKFRLREIQLYQEITPDFYRLLSERIHQLYPEIQRLTALDKEKLIHFFFAGGLKYLEGAYSEDYKSIFDGLAFDEPVKVLTMLFEFFRRYENEYLENTVLLPWAEALKEEESKMILTVDGNAYYRYTDALSRMVLEQIENQMDRLSYQDLLTLYRSYLEHQNTLPKLITLDGMREQEYGKKIREILLGKVKNMSDFEELVQEVKDLSPEDFDQIRNMPQLIRTVDQDNLKASLEFLLENSVTQTFFFKHLPSFVKHAVENLKMDPEELRKLLDDLLAANDIEKYWLDENYRIGLLRSDIPYIYARSYATLIHQIIDENLQLTLIDQYYKKYRHKFSFINRGGADLKYEIFSDEVLVKTLIDILRKKGLGDIQIAKYVIEHGYLPTQDLFKAMQDPNDRETLFTLLVQSKNKYLENKVSEETFNDLVSFLSWEWFFEKGHIPEYTQEREVTKQVGGGLLRTEIERTERRPLSTLINLLKQILPSRHNENMLERFWEKFDFENLNQEDFEVLFKLLQRMKAYFPSRSYDLNRNFADYEKFKDPQDEKRMEYIQEKDGYAPFYYRNVENIEKIFALKLGRQVLDRWLVHHHKKLDDSDWDIREKIDLILNCFPEKSNYRSKLLLDLFSKSVFEVAPNHLETVFDHLEEGSLKDLAAKRILLDRYQSGDLDLSNYAKVKAVVDRYFSQESSMRREFMNAFLQDAEVTLEELKAHQGERQLAKISKSKKKGVYHVLAEYIADDLENRPANDKLELFEWLSGLRKEKPVLVQYYEYTYGVNLAEFRDFLSMQTPEERYAFVGVIFVGPKGILNSSETKDNFIKNIFKESLGEEPSDDNTLFLIFQALFNASAEMKQLDLVQGMFEHLIQPGVDAKQTRNILIKKMLISFGVVGVKLGQILSNKPELIKDPELRKVLSDLSDRVEPLGKEYVLGALRYDRAFEALEGMIHSIRRLLGSASIKQGYLVKMLDGTERALKYVRPLAHAEVRENLQILRSVFNALKGKILGLDQISDVLMDQVEKAVKRELDMASEIQNQEEIGNFSRGISEEGWEIVIPKVDPNLKGKQYFADEFKPGRPLKGDVADELRQSGQLKVISKALLTTMLRQIFILGKYHADLHPGNILVDKDRQKVVILDFGNSGTLSDEEQESLINLFSFLRLGFLTGIMKVLENMVDDKELLNTHREEVGDEIQSIVRNQILKLPEKVEAIKEVLEKRKISFSGNFEILFKFFETITYISQNLEEKEIEEVIMKVLEEKYKWSVKGLFLNLYGIFGYIFGGIFGISTSSSSTPAKVTVETPETKAPVTEAMIEGEIGTQRTETTSKLTPSETITVTGPEEGEEDITGVRPKLDKRDLIGTSFGRIVKKGENIIGRVSLMGLVLFLTGCAQEEDAPRTQITISEDGTIDFGGDYTTQGHIVPKTQTDEAAVEESFGRLRETIPEGSEWRTWVLDENLTQNHIIKYTVEDPNAEFPTAFYQGERLYINNQHFQQQDFLDGSIRHEGGHYEKDLKRQKGINDIDGDGISNQEEEAKGTNSEANGTNPYGENISDEEYIVLLDTANDIGPIFALIRWIEDAEGGHYELRFEKRVPWSLDNESTPENEEEELQRQAALVRLYRELEIETDSYKIQKLQKLIAYYEQDSSPDGGAIGKWEISFFDEPRDGKIIFDVKGIEGNAGLMILDEEVMVEPLPKNRTELILKILRDEFDRAIEKGISEDQAKYIQTIIGHLEKMIQSGQVYLMEENEYVKGYGTKDYIFLSKKLFDSVSGGLGLFHEAGESYFAAYPDRLPPGLNAHTFLRGLGKGARKGSRNESRELTPVENALPEWKGMKVGLQDLLFGPERNVLDLGGIPEPVEVEQAMKIPTIESKGEPRIDDLINHLLISDKEASDRTRAELEKFGVYAFVLESTGNWNKDFRNADQESMRAADNLASHPEVQVFLYKLMSDMAHNVGHIDKGNRMVITLRVREILEKHWLQIEAVDNGPGFLLPIEWSMRKRNTTVERRFRGGIGLSSIQGSVLSESRFNRLTVETRKENEKGEKITWSAQYRRGESVTLPEGPSGSKIKVEHALFKEEPQENLRRFVEKYFQKYGREPDSSEIALYFGLTAYEVSQMVEKWKEEIISSFEDQNGITQKHLGTQGISADKIKKEIYRIPLRPATDAEKAQAVEMLDVIRTYAPEVLADELEKLDLDIGKIGLEALTQVLESLARGETETKIQYNSAEYTIRIKLTEDELGVPAHALTYQEENVIEIVIAQGRLDALPHELIEALLLTRPENKSPPGDEKKLKEHAVHTKMVLLEPLFDPSLNSEERVVDGRVKGRVARELADRSPEELQALVDGLQGAIADIQEKRNAGALSSGSTKFAKKLALNISWFAEGSEESRVVSIGHQEQVIENAQFLTDLLFKDKAVEEKSIIVNNLIKRTRVVSSFRAGFDMLGQIIRGNISFLSRDFSLLSRDSLAYVLPYVISSLVQFGFLTWIANVYVGVILCALTISVFLLVKLSTLMTAPAQTYRYNVFVHDATAGSSLIHEWLHLLTQFGLIHTDLPAASALDALYGYRKEGTKFIHGSEFRSGMRLFRAYPDNPRLRWESLIKEEQLEFHGIKNYSDIFISTVERFEGKGPVEPMWTYSVGRILAGTAEALSEKTGRPDDAWEYLRLIALGTDPVEAELKILGEMEKPALSVEASLPSGITQKHLGTQGITVSDIQNEFDRILVRGMEEEEKAQAGQMLDVIQSYAPEVLATELGKLGLDIEKIGLDAMIQVLESLARGETEVKAQYNGVEYTVKFKLAADELDVPAHALTRQEGNVIEIAFVQGHLDALPHEFIEVLLLTRPENKSPPKDEKKLKEHAVHTKVVLLEPLFDPVLKTEERVIDGNVKGRVARELSEKSPEALRALVEGTSAAVGDIDIKENAGALNLESANIARDLAQSVSKFAQKLSATKVNEGLITKLTKDLLNAGNEDIDQIKSVLKELGVFSFVLESTGAWNIDFFESTKEARLQIEQYADRNEGLISEEHLLEFLRHLAHNVGHIGEGNRMVITLRTKEILGRRWLEVNAVDNGEGFKNSIEWSMQMWNTTQGDRVDYSTGMTRGGLGLFAVKDFVIGRSKFNRITVETRRENGEAEKMSWSIDPDVGREETAEDGPSGSRITIEYILTPNEPKETLLQFINSFNREYGREPALDVITLYFGVTRDVLFQEMLGLKEKGQKELDGYLSEEIQRVQEETKEFENLYQNSNEPFKKALEIFGPYYEKYYDAIKKKYPFLSSEIKETLKNIFQRNIGGGFDFYLEKKGLSDLYIWLAIGSVCDLKDTSYVFLQDRNKIIEKVLERIWDASPLMRVRARIEGGGLLTKTDVKEFVERSEEFVINKILNFERLGEEVMDIAIPISLRKELSKRIDKPWIGWSSETQGRHDVKDTVKTKNNLPKTLRDLRDQVRQLAQKFGTARKLLPEVGRVLEEEILPSIVPSDRSKVIDAAVGEIRRILDRRSASGSLAVKEVLIPKSLKNKMIEGLAAKGYPKNEVKMLLERLDKMAGPVWVDSKGKVKGSLAWISLTVEMMDEAEWIEGDRKKHGERMLRAMLFHEYAHQLLRPGLSQAKQEDLNRRLGKFLDKFANRFETRDVEEVLAQFVSYKFTGENEDLFEDVEMDLESFLSGEMFPIINLHTDTSYRWEIAGRIREAQPGLLETYKGEDVHLLLIDYRNGLVRKAGLERFNEKVREILDPYLFIRRMDPDLKVEVGDWTLWDILGEGGTGEREQKRRLARVSEQVEIPVNDELARKKVSQVLRLAVRMSSGAVRAWERLMDKGVYIFKGERKGPRIYVLRVELPSELTGIRSAYDQMKKVDSQAFMVLNTTLEENKIRKWMRAQGLDEKLLGKKIHLRNLTGETTVRGIYEGIQDLLKGKEFKINEDMILVTPVDPSEAFEDFRPNEFKIVVGRLGKETALMPDAMGLALVLGSVDKAFENNLMRVELKDKLKAFFLEVAREYFGGEDYEEVKKEIETKIIPEIETNGFFKLPTWTKNFNSLMREYAIQQTYIEAAA